LPPVFMTAYMYDLFEGSFHGPIPRNLEF